MAILSTRQTTVDAKQGEPSPPTGSPSLPPAIYPAQSEQVKCTVEVGADNTAYAMILIEPHILKRLQTRYPKNLDQHLWDNVFKPALYGAVY
jgi:hypothetical protein